MFSNKIKNNTVIIGVVIVAFILRIWKFWDFDFMHDELSALSRTRFDNFHDLWHKGIKIDGHPAGVQLFIKGLTMVFGYSPFFLKLPFIIAGTGSVFLSYAIGKIWWNKNSALLIAAFLTITQQTLFYDTIIRPYGIGLFFSLLLLLVWTRIFIQNRQSWKMFLVFGVLLAVLGYTHYFALLFGLLLTSVSVLYVSKNSFLKLLISSIVAILLYIPHFEVFIYQLGIGGVGGTGGWLKPPTPKFFLKYGLYIFNHSYYLIGIFLVVLTAGASLKNQTNDKFKKRLVLIYLFLAPILIGYFYSVFRNPVLQVSVLIFSFPALLLFVFSWTSETLSLPKISSLTFILIFGGIFSLIYERDFYNVHYQLPVGEYYNTLKKSGEKSLHISNHEDVFLKIYGDLKGQYFSHYTFDEDCTLVSEFQQFLQDTTYKSVVVGNVYKTNFGLASCYYPYTSYFQGAVGLEIARMTKNPLDSNLYYASYSVSDSDWPGSKAHKLPLKTSKKGNFIVNKINILKLLRQPHDIIEVYAKIKVDTSLNNKVQLIISGHENGEQRNWASVSNLKQATKNLQTFYLCRAYSIPYEDNEVKTDELRFRIENSTKNPIEILECGIRIRPGNPNRYALYEKYR